MKKHIVIPALFIALALFVTSSLLAQSPQGIPYQAVIRNADGSVMANSAVSLTFMIHDGTADGVVVYQESHSLTSNAQGLVSCVVGNGVVSEGNFAQINWGSGAKFLHVMMGSTDLGTQQMLSVPYALYADRVGVRVSATGDTLTVGGHNVIVPGISAANPTNNIPTSGLGAQVLPGNATCANEYINVVGCNGQTSLTYDGRTYDLVEIGGQCWFADNLATDQYRNGDLIPTGLDNASIGAYAIYNNDPANDATYGKLYNWYTTVDSRGLCPTGWHVPTDCEWMYLEGSLGMSVTDQEIVGIRGTNEGGAMKATIIWSSPNSGATNSSGFTALPGGYRDYDGSYATISDAGTWWSSSESGLTSAWYRYLVYDFSDLIRFTSYLNKENSFSVRCVRDSESSPIQGCTDGAACNFMANANQDDGSCYYPNSECNDNNSNTVMDFSDGNCICLGFILGCTDFIAANYYPLATLDDGSCVFYSLESCDGLDNDGNGQIDEGFDIDSDGYSTCSVPISDCDDTNSSIYPGAIELCQGIDNNCNGIVNDQCDLDMDGFTIIQGDCDDENAAIHPQASEPCGSLLDINCDGSINLACGGIGFEVLPGNTICSNQQISVTGCGGLTNLIYDDLAYELIEIGGQCWFAENLATDQYRNGDPIPTGLDNTTWSNTTNGAYANYNNDLENDSIYGKLYNWYTTVDTRGLCPTGWHVPTDCEWMYLESSLGMPVADQETVGNNRGTNEGGALKAATNWTSPNTGATNSSGFTALPGGYRVEDGTYDTIGYYGFWWSSTQLYSNNAWFRNLECFSSIVYRQYFNKPYGISVRCVRD
jgi:uncharacterized protein (TIGR02145 family)